MTELSEVHFYILFDFQFINNNLLTTMEMLSFVLTLKHRL